MSTKADRLLDRIQRDDDFAPRVGDIFRRDRWKGPWYVIATGVPSSRHNYDYVVLAHKDSSGDWLTHQHRLDLWGTMEDASDGYRLIDTGWKDFIWGGFSPNDTARPYVLFKQPAGVVFRAGCRRFATFAQASRHWRGGGISDMWSQKKAIAKGLFEQARRRGWLKVKRQPPVKKVRR